MSDKSFTPAELNDGFVVAIVVRCLQLILVAIVRLLNILLSDDFEPHVSVIFYFQI